MAILTTRSIDTPPSVNLVDENGVPLTDETPPLTPPTDTPVLPLMLMLRLRLHS